MSNGNGLSNGKDRKRRRRRIIWISVAAVIVAGGGYGVMAALRPNRTIDPSKLASVERGASANLEAAEATLASAKATLERNKVDAEGPDVPFLKLSMERAEREFREGVVSLSVVEDAQKNYQMGLNKQVSAQTNLTVSKADIAKAGAQVAQARAALENAQEDLKNSTIVSPIHGLVLSRDVNVGDAVSSILILGSQATPIMTLGDVSEVYVQGKVDEADIGKVYLNQPARIVVESFKDKKNVLMAPEAAMIYDKDRNAKIEIPDAKGPNGKKKVDVKLGISNGVKTEILAGLNEKQQVVLQ